ncbi:hypothetical protein QTP88_001713 [Uroleucon formosanum]
MLSDILSDIDGIQLFTFYENEQVIEPEKALPNSVFIFDDIISEDQKIARTYFSRGRHNLVDVFYLAQSYSKEPKQLLRDNANFIVLFKQDETNLKHIYMEHCSGDIVASFMAASGEVLGELIKAKENINANKTYGPKIRANGSVHLGKKDINLVDNTLSIKDISYQLTQRLGNLIFSKNPKLYNKNDLDAYKSILIQTSAHLTADEEKIKQGGNKYHDIIQNLFRSGRGLSMKLQRHSLVYWNDPNELVDRLWLLLVSKAAGRLGRNYFNFEALSQIIKSIISKEVEKAEMYSVQLDTTQDIPVVDQCSIIVRYVIDTKICERLIAVVKCTSSKGINFVNLLLNNFTKLGIDSKKCIGNSADGAANMQDAYNGFSKKLSEVTLTQTHIWCYAHVLNLVICDITNKILQGISLFGLLNGCAVFLKESYTRMDIWTNKNTKQRICSIGETRWWSKDSALTKVFGYFNCFDNSLFVELVTSFEEICENSKIKPEARLKAIGFIEGLCKYETILTAQIYLRIFNITTPLSKYLQGHGVNFVAAFQMVNQTLNSLKNINRDFTSITQAADNFVRWANNKIEKTNIQISDSLAAIRHRKKTKQFAYESTDDNIIMDPLKLFEVNVYNVIFDSIIQSIQLRFEKHKELFADFNCLDPNNFYSKDCLPENALKNIFTKIEPFQTNISYEQLRLEYIDFVSEWDKLKINCINI